MTPTVSASFGVWLTTRQVAQYVPCKSVGAAREWIRRRGVKRRGNGTVARADVDRAIARRRRISPHSLVNLRVGHAAAAEHV